MIQTNLRLADYKEASVSLTEIDSTNLDLLASKATGVSNRYARVDSRNLIEQTLNTLGKAGVHNVEVKVTARPRASSTIHFITYTLKDFGINIDDGLYPRIIQRNSYNGECTLSVGVGLYRLVCSNGLMLGKNSFYTTIKHQQGPIFDGKIDGLQPAIAAALDDIHNRLMQSIQRLRSTFISYEKAIEIVGNLGLSTRMTAKVLDKLHKNWIFKSGRIQDTDHTMWTLYNIVNEVHRIYSRSQVVVMSRNIGLLDQLEDIAQAA